MRILQEQHQNSQAKTDEFGKGQIQYATDVLAFWIWLPWFEIAKDNTWSIPPNRMSIHKTSKTTIFETPP